MRLSYLAHRKWLKFRGALTLGNRAIVVQEGSVLLVRLTYHQGWFLPGGGVKRGETFEASMVRELQEECGIEPRKWRLQGIYLNQGEGRIDHVATYVVTQFDGEPFAADPREIADVAFFGLHELPIDLQKGHRRRIHEMLGQEPISSKW